MKFSIRPYRKGEERYVAEAHRRVYSDEYRWNSVFTDYAMSIPLQFAEKEPDSREEMWVAENEDTAELLGSVMLCSTEDPQVGQLRLFLVEKRARGCGIGSALADTVLERAEKEAAAAEKIRAAAEKTAEDKKTIAETLAAKLSEAEKKAQGFDALKDRLTAAETALKEAEQAIKDVRREAAEAAKDAARAAEKEREEAVYKVREEASKEANTLREELRAARSEADNARREAETARTAAVAELTQAHLKDLSGLRSKLDERTEDLMRARQEISDLKIRLQEERQKNTAEKRDGANKDQK